jgi:hypothetical protein
MNLDILKEALRPWMQIDTWHTNHPLDTERFHNALKTAFDKLGVSIDADDFEGAMLDLIDEYHQDWPPDHKERMVDRFVLHAEHISSYLSDVGRG